MSNNSIKVKVEVEKNTAITQAVKKNSAEVNTEPPYYSTSEISAIANTETRIAGAIINGHRAVAYINDLIVHFDPTNEDHYLKYYGISLNSAIIGEAVTVQKDGNVFLNNWGLTPDTIYISGPNGQLIIGEITGVQQIVGYSVDSNTMRLTNQPPILR